MLIVVVKTPFWKRSEAKAHVASGRRSGLIGPYEVLHINLRVVIKNALTTLLNSEIFKLIYPRRS